MELNKEIQLILLDFSELCKENNWGKSQIEIRSIYDTFRIQNIVERNEQVICHECKDQKDKWLFKCEDCTLKEFKYQNT